MALALNNNGIIPSEEYVLERSKEIATLIENIAQENNAIVVYKEFLVGHKAYVKDITQNVLTMYQRNSK